MSLFDDASLVITPSGYKEGKLYSIKPTDGSGDLSVTRATTATRVNSAGLVEVVPYNLLSYSEQFDNVAWAKSATSIVANQTTAPNGTLTADKSVIDTSTSFHDSLIGSYSVSNGQVYTLSIYAKKSVGIESVYFYNADGNRVAKFNLNTGAYIGNASTNGYNAYSSYTTETLANGWYRFTATFTATSTASTFYIIGISTNTADTVTPLTGNGTDNVFIWGAQAVEGSTAKEYQRTETRLNIPRLDYTNSSCPSILVEPQRTNLTTYSEDLSNAKWYTANSTITSNVINSPSGIQNADLLTENNLFGDHAIYEIVYYFVSGTTYTTSFYVKANGRTKVELVTANSTTCPNGRFDLIAQTATPINGSFDAKIESVGNGWFRCSVSKVAPNTGLDVPYFVMVENFGILSRTGDGTSGMYFWGMQTEIGSYATSYIPTTSASVTRNADVISKTGISSLIGQTEGTVFFDGTVNNAINPTTNIINTNKNAPSISTFTLQRAYAGNKYEFYIFKGNGGFDNIGLSSTNNYALGQRVKIAVRYKSGDMAMYINGILEDTSSDTYTTNGTKSELFLNDAVTYFAYQEIVSFNSVVLFTSGLTNDELAQLTTI